MLRATSDDLSVAYDDHAGAEPALLCLPGWCAGRGAFDELATLLSPRHRVLSLDWRGHGASDLADGDFGSAQLVRDALAVIQASGAREIVPLATAHAGWIAIELRRALGAERIPKLILVDWIVGAAPPPFVDALKALQDRDKWQAVRDRLFAMWLEGVDHPGVIGFVRDDMGGYDYDMWARAGREISRAYASFGSPLEALQPLSAPTLHLYAQPPDPGYLQMQQQFAAANPWFHVHKLDARSHFPTLEVPRQMVAPIERFL
jgi:pimeloyl-ACP methyl ester carboxylesterase